MQPVKIILNPYSGRGGGGRSRDLVRQALEQAGVAFDLAETNGVGHAIELASAARAAGYETVVAAGGDGTISEVMNGLASATSAGATVGKLGILPLGTGNDFADIIGCQRDLFEAARSLGRGRTRFVDLGYAKIVGPDIQRERYFDNNMGIGFEAHVTLESYKVKGLSGVSLYVVAALKSLRSYHAPQVEISWEDENGQTQQNAQRVLLVTVGNSPRTGGGFYLTPDALLDDGLLDVGVLDNLSRLRIVGLLPKALKGKHTSDPAVTMLRTRRLTICSDEEMPVQLDGEVVTRNADRVEIELQPGRLEVVA